MIENHSRYTFRFQFTFVFFLTSAYFHIRSFTFRKLSKIFQSGTVLTAGFSLVRVGGMERACILSIQNVESCHTFHQASSWFLSLRSSFPNLWVATSLSVGFQSNVSPLRLSCFILPSSHDSISWHLVLYSSHYSIWNCIYLIIVCLPR